MGKTGSIAFYAILSLITCVMATRVRQPAHESADSRLRQMSLNRLFIAGIFVILFAVSALRSGIGNDYWQYADTAHEAYVGGYVVTEAGFNVLVRAVYTLFNCECYEVVFAIFAFVTLALFLHTLYRDSVDFAFSFFLFMSLGIYFQTFNTVRYYFALSIALCSMKYVLEKDYVRFVFYILLASLFHKSVLVVIPIYLIASIEWKKWFYVALTCVSVLCFLARGLVLKLALVLYPSYNDTIYLEGGTSITSVIRIALVLVFCAWVMQCKETLHCKEALQQKSERYKEMKLYIQLNFLAFLAATFFSFLPVVTRLVYYFSISQLLLLPLIVEAIGNERVKKRVKAVIALACVGYFALFLLTADKDGVGLLPYQSWVFGRGQ